LDDPPIILLPDPQYFNAVRRMKCGVGEVHMFGARGNIDRGLLALGADVSPEREEIPETDTNTVADVEVESVDAADGCCYGEVARLVEHICFSADACVKKEVTRVVARACLQPPGMTDDELRSMILSEWNAMMA
jgi:hypothetical protein